MTPVESLRLRYFVAVAEELSFVRASQRIHIAPPALSRAIRELEAHLGVKLFDRSSRHVALTEAGSALLPDVRRALQDIDAATTRIRRLGGPGRRLTVAYKSDMNGGLLRQIGDLLANERPAVSVEALLGGWGEQPKQLRQGLADVALLYEPFDQEGLAFELLVEEPRLVALPTANPLAGREVVSLAQLEEAFAPTPGPYVWQVRTRDGVGTLPRIRDISHLLQLVELGEIVAMLPASVAVRFLRDPIRYRPVAELAPARLFVAWPRESESADITSFVRIAKNVAGTEAQLQILGVAEIEMSALSLPHSVDGLDQTAEREQYLFSNSSGLS
ncbi:MAG: LysR substrate-binding domain-containing protein [Candidatus Dormiibacterota bacterium]